MFAIWPKSGDETSYHIRDFIRFSILHTVQITDCMLDVPGVSMLSTLNDMFGPEYLLSFDFLFKIGDISFSMPMTIDLRKGYQIDVPRESPVYVQTQQIYESGDAGDPEEFDYFYDQLNTPENRNKFISTIRAKIPSTVVPDEDLNNTFTDLRLYIGSHSSSAQAYITTIVAPIMDRLFYGFESQGIRIHASLAWQNWIGYTAAHSQADFDSLLRTPGFESADYYARYAYHSPQRS